MEDILKSQPSNFEALLLLTRVLVKENSLSDAKETYQKVIAINPRFQDEELDGMLRISNQAYFEDEEEFEDENGFQNKGFMTKPDINFEHVGGMADVKTEIELKIIHPINFPDLYKAYGKKAGGGILLYGPPGCGKTYMAKATAGEIKANFISVGLNEILDMWEDLKTGRAKDQAAKKRMIETYNTIYNTNYGVRTNCGSCISTCFDGIKKIYKEYSKD